MRNLRHIRTHQKPKTKNHPYANQKPTLGQNLNRSTKNKHRKPTLGQNLDGSMDNLNKLRTSAYPAIAATRSGSTFNVKAAQPRLNKLEAYMVAMNDNVIIDFYTNKAEDTCAASPLMRHIRHLVG